MTFPGDDVLLDFDYDRLADFSRLEAEEILRSEHGDLYRNHLVAAHWIEGWIERANDRPVRRRTDDEDEAWESGLREVAAHLRQADLMPGGTLYREELDRLRSGPPEPQI